MLRPKVIDGENRCVGHIHPVQVIQDNPVAPVDDVVILNIGDYVIDAYQLDRVRAVLVRIGEQTVHGHQGEDKIALGNVGEIGGDGESCRERTIGPICPNIYC